MFAPENQTKYGNSQITVAEALDAWGRAQADHKKASQMRIIAGASRMPSSKNRSKPRIRKVVPAALIEDWGLYRWICEGEGVYGLGESPRDSYADWQRARTACIAEIVRKATGGV
jgi:hypothetical protein